MGGLTGIVAGFAVVAGAVALYRFVEGRIDAARSAMTGGDKEQAPVIDFEQDPKTGVFRAK